MNNQSPTHEANRPKIPIFVITHNRLTVLQKTLASFERILQNPYEVVVHDNASTYEPLKIFLKQSDLRVYWNAGNDLNDVAQSVETYFNETGSISQYYVVTDPDVELDDAMPGDVLDLYAHLLATRADIVAVGPELRVDDIPDHYPLKKELLRRHRIGHCRDHIVSFPWHKTSQKGALRPLDTTFGMYRRSFVFKRLNKALLTHAPYVARHLDWYINPNTMAEDEIYYMNERTNRWGHWGSTMLRDKLTQ
jgi:glycosyltransferase involved in cell wall biosynthesis